MNVYINTRTLQSPLTGVQRYTLSMLEHLDSVVERIEPTVHLTSSAGHLWEQLILPGRVDGGLLWSPSNTGPLTVQNQVVTIHDASVLDHPEWFNRKFAQWYKWLLPRLIRKARVVITDSTFSKDRLLRHSAVVEDKIRVVPIAAAGQFTPSDTGQDESILASLNICQPYVVVVGSLDPRKNLSRVLNAWRHIHSTRPRLTLIVIGAGGRVFGNLGIGDIPTGVRFMGRIDDKSLPTVYRKAEALVYASIYEGFGLPPLEAMACGTPVVTSSNSAIPEVVGDAALCVNPFSSKEIADAVITVLDDMQLRKTLINRGLDRARMYSWERTAKTTLEIISEITGITFDGLNVSVK